MSRRSISALILGLALLFGAAHPASADSTVDGAFIADVTTPPLGGPHLARNSGAFSMNSTLCAHGAVHLGKSGKAPAGAGGCHVSASGNIDGNCGLAAGTMSGTFTSFSGQVYRFNGNVTVAGTKFLFLGDASKQSTGQGGSTIIEGSLIASPNDPDGCIDGTQTRWLFIGTIHIVVTTN